MRRWLAIFLLALLPLQLSWAAVAAYCGHESDTQGQHLGHHAHQHAGDAEVDTDSDPAGADNTTGTDFDCGHCHGSCCSMPAPVDAPAPLAIALQPAGPVERAVRTRVQHPPERPQWQRFA